MKIKPYLLLKAGQTCLDKRIKEKDRWKYTKEPTYLDMEFLWNGQKYDLSSVTKITIIIDPNNDLIQFFPEHLVATPYLDKISNLIKKLLKQMIVYYRNKKLYDR